MLRRHGSCDEAVGQEPCGSPAAWLQQVLRAAVHLWADQSRHQCAWAQAYYQTKRQQGQSHACALRCLGQRWLNILWKMWQTGTRYDEAKHMRNQVQHGSWVIQPG